MKRQGSELKRRKTINPHPKRPESQQYRDLVKQNEWLRNNVFDSLGNYFFCSCCIHNALGISFQRLSRQRSIKKRLSNDPVGSMTKSEVEEERLSERVVMPQGYDLSFMKWWKTIPNTSMVDVRYPHQRHGNAGKVSNSAKKDAKSDFLTFVDVNSQPNGRRADSSSATLFFLPNFRTIQTAKKGVARYEERVLQSLVGVFNKLQRENRGDTISNYSASTWLKKERPKCSIYPHKLDYCDYCAIRKESMRRNQTTLNRIRQTGSSNRTEQKSIEAEMAKIESELETHRCNARGSQKYYFDTKKRCASQWKDIQELEAKLDKTALEIDLLKSMKNNYTLVLSADYQMQKLVPYWGSSPQPGATYYLQKLSHDIFGIVDHSDDHSTIYLFDETIGPKNTDHTISLILQYIRNRQRVPSWVRRVHIFLDNTGSTNKNAYFMGWGMEMVQQGEIDCLHFSFLVVGHTKFDIDRVFSVTAKAYSTSDVFNTQALLDVMSQADNITGVLVNGNMVLNWRDTVSEIYSKLPGIRALHDFLIVPNPTSKNAMMFVRDFCFEGAPKLSTITLTGNKSPEFSCVPGLTENYVDLRKIRTLQDTKLNHLKQMYRNYNPSGTMV